MPKSGDSVSPEAFARYSSKVSAVISSTAQKFFALHSEREHLVAAFRLIYETPSLRDVLSSDASSMNPSLVALSCSSLRDRDAQSIMSLHEEFGWHTDSNMLYLMHCKVRTLFSGEWELLGKVVSGIDAGAVSGPLQKIIPLLPSDQKKSLTKASDAILQLGSLLKEFQNRSKKLLRAIESKDPSRIAEEWKSEGEVFETVEGIVSSLSRDIKLQIPNEQRSGVLSFFGGFLLALALLSQGCASVQSVGQNSRSQREALLRGDAQSVQGEMYFMDDLALNAQKQGFLNREYSIPSNPVPSGWRIIGTGRNIVDGNIPVRVDGDFVYIVGFSKLYGSNNEREALADALRDASRTYDLLTTGATSGETVRDGMIVTTRVSLPPGQQMGSQTFRLVKQGADGSGVIVHALMRFQLPWTRDASERFEKLSASSPQKQAEIILMARAGRM